MIQVWTEPHGQARQAAFSSALRGKGTMHDLMIALAFIGMVVAPAIVAAKSGADTADDLED
jgi:hypothetical protein